MYYQDYFWFLGAIALCMIFAIYASRRVNATFAKYNGVACHSGMTGYDTVLQLMRANDVNGISIGRVNGKLADHYHPTKQIINLSESTYNNNSIAAVAVAAHEMGHVMQKKQGYLFFKIRTALVPVVNFGSRLAMPLVFIGLLIDLLAATAPANVGFYIAMVGVILYGSSFLFALITLPVELNASRRAKQMLVTQGVIATKNCLQQARFYLRRRLPILRHF